LYLENTLLQSEGLTLSYLSFVVKKQFPREVTVNQEDIGLINFTGINVSSAFLTCLNQFVA